MLGVTTDHETGFKVLHRLALALVIVFVLLQIGDATTTYLGLQRGFVEGNPMWEVIPSVLHTNFYVAMFVSHSALAMAGVLIFAFNHKFNRKLKIGKLELGLVLNLAVFIYAVLLNVWNLYNNLSYLLR